MAGRTTGPVVLKRHRLPELRFQAGTPIAELLSALQNAGGGVIVDLQGFIVTASSTDLQGGEYSVILPASPVGAGYSRLADSIQQVLTFLKETQAANNKAAVPPPIPPPGHPPHSNALGSRMLNSSNMRLPGGQSFWSTVDTLFEQRADTKSLIHRWDWHIWQCIAALIPAAGVVSLAKWGEQQMQRKDALLLAQDEALAQKAAEAQAVMQQEQSAAREDVRTQHVLARLLALEQAVQAMQKSGITGSVPGDAAKGPT